MIDDPNTKPAYVNCKEWSDKVRLFHEKHILGLYLSGHPIDPYKAELLRYCGELTLNNMIPGTMDKPNFVTVAGVVISVVEGLSSKDNRKFYRIAIDDSTSTFEFMLFGSQAEAFEEIQKSIFDKGK